MPVSACSTIISARMMPTSVPRTSGRNAMPRCRVLSILACRTGRLTLKRNYEVFLSLGLAFAMVVLSSSALGSSVASRKRSKSDHDIAAIGHRKIACSDACIGNWYSIEQEKKISEQLSASLEQSTILLHDPITAAYVEGLAETIAQNSDAQMPITVRVTDSAKVYALTLPGGYQYISRGLLLQLHSEGELASVLARGIAHTALRSGTREATMASLTRSMAIPVIFVGQDAPVNDPSGPELAAQLTLLKFRRNDELDADYFGVQYLYKAGYDAECFVRFIQTMWPTPPSGTPTSTAFSPFPPIGERLEILKKEISDILPNRDQAVTSTPEFTAFQGRIRSLPNPPPVSPEPWTTPAPSK